MKTKQSGYTDPTRVRLSDRFLLSDLMGCNSVYSFGYRNLFDGDRNKLAEGQALCEHVLEPLLEYSRFSISYGYISPELSRRIVKYQDPDKPSYHRWDAGAACDVVLHERIDPWDEPPIVSACWIDENLPVSRVITYSESPFICVASRVSEIDSGDHRRALYENRYMGERKPKYISYSDNPNTRRRQKEEIELPHGWRGAGYPTYHGGGIRQAQHVRTSKYTVLSDFLFAEEAVRQGYVNKPTGRAIRKFRRAGEIYDALVDSLNVHRLSIVKGWESPEWSPDSPHNWTDGVSLVLVPTVGVTLDEVADAAAKIPGVHTYGVGDDCVYVGARLEAS